MENKKETVADERAARVVVQFGNIGIAGPFPVIAGQVTVPDVTMADLAYRMRAPVAGEAVNLQAAREYLDQWGCLADPNVRALLENAERAAPQASEAKK